MEESNRSCTFVSLKNCRNCNFVNEVVCALLNYVFVGIVEDTLPSRLDKEADKKLR